MLCHSVEDFNNHDTDNLKSLGEEGMVMYLNYLEANAKHKVNVSPSIVEEICAILVLSKENLEAIVQLRGSDSPLFRYLTLLFLPFWLRLNTINDPPPGWRLLNIVFANKTKTWNPRWNALNSSKDHFNLPIHNWQNCYWPNLSCFQSLWRGIQEPWVQDVPQFPPEQRVLRVSCGQSAKRWRVGAVRQQSQVSSANFWHKFTSTFAPHTVVSYQNESVSSK